MTESQAPTREELERRIVDLEVRAAFQTQTIELLDGVLREFTVRVEALERALAEVRGQIAAGPWDPPDPAAPAPGTPDAAFDASGA